MVDDQLTTPDWRRADSYRPLLQADAAVWAWEFGRRARRAGLEPGAGPPLAGLCFAGEGPSGDALPAVLWRWPIDPSVPVLEVSPAARQDPEAFDLGTMRQAVIVVCTDDDEQHVLICDGPRRLRLAIARGDVLAGPVTCVARLPSRSSALAALDALRGLVSLRDTGRLPSPAGRPSGKQARWLEMLRAHDARASGASQRDIAATLFGAARADEDWNGPSDYMRMRVHRLLRAAEHLVAGGYRGLLGKAAAPSAPSPTITRVWRSPAWRTPAWRTRGADLAQRSVVFLGTSLLCAEWLRGLCGWA